GTLDARGVHGADGGDILIHADRDIDVAPAAVLGFGGHSGGRAALIAERDLDIGKGSVIDGSARSLKGHGGAAELSGHGRLLLGSMPTLGRGGSLLLDPNTVFIYGTNASDCGAANLCISASQVDQSLDNGQETLIVAGNHIQVGSDASIFSQSNSGLLLGIGQTSAGSTGAFGDGQTFPSSGGLSFIRGAATGGSGSIDFLTSLTDGSIASVGIGGAFEAYSALDKGHVTLGDVTAVGGLTVAAVGNIDAGNLFVSGGGFALGSQQVKPSDVVASASLVSDTGTVKAASASVDALANSYSYTDGNGYAHDVSRGDASLVMRGTSVAVGDTSNFGGVSVFAQGVASADISAHAGGSVSIAGTTFADVSGNATDTATLGGFRSTLSSGLASISLHTDQPTAGNDTGSIVTGGIEAPGPNASINLESGTVATDFIYAQAYLSSFTEGPQSQRYTAKQNGKTILDSDFGVATLSVIGRGGNATQPSVDIGGTTTLLGPAVEATVQAAGDVNFGDSVSITGQGFSISGSGNTLLAALQDGSIAQFF
ncbi:MAG TPA: hypothetical protein VHE37_06320, partial [Nevskiaceae bacterium]|nr:hypothetical protein [Nevskiaceae bacterium]